ncbi:hypothetical protein QTI33_27065 [Variovorax sp. J22P271]|uniref:hypothetical protein n=1 Tax=Variovorax davisae TaxID=3053515 RepID=UPI0025776F18|nr:hypothetical protein [Variovorax sp. J22P271]MDM0035823.1 hypothetical protein [Variovorax sp. J22P271]
MSVICPKCHTENRAIAKFCIECISTLPTLRAEDGFAPTLRLRWPAAAPTPAAEAAAPFAKGLWVSVAALSVALLIGAAGWVVAGAGGWYLYSAGKAQAGPVSEPEHAAPAPSPIAPIAPIAQAAPEGAAPPVARPAAPAAASARQPAAGAPQAACAGLGFIAEARCMAAQCLKPLFAQHPQCDEVRRRQRLEEAKRNPVAP